MPNITDSTQVIHVQPDATPPKLQHLSSSVQLLCDADLCPCDAWQVYQRKVILWGQLLLTHQQPKQGGHPTLASRGTSNLPESCHWNAYRKQLGTISALKQQNQRWTSQFCCQVPHVLPSMSYIWDNWHSHPNEIGKCCRRDTYHNIIDVFVDLINKNVKLLHWGLHSFQIIGELLYHGRFQDLNCNKR